MGKNILIVEDDKDILFTIQQVLENQGHATEGFRNGFKALGYLQNTKSLPDLIVLDFMMPEMDGASFREEQEKDMKIAAIPVLLMTADAHADVKHIQIGATAYIKKPFDIDRFLNLVEKILNT